MSPKKISVPTIRSSAAEYLAFVAGSGESNVNAVYADENFWLSQKMIALLRRFQKSVTFEIGFWRKITSLYNRETCDFSPRTSKVALSKLSGFERASSL